MAPSEDGEPITAATHDRQSLALQCGVCKGAKEPRLLLGVRLRHAPEEFEQQVPQVPPEGLADSKASQIPGGSSPDPPAQVREPGPGRRANEQSVLAGEGVGGEAASLTGERPGPSVLEECLVSEAKSGAILCLRQNSSPNQMIDQCLTVFEEDCRYPQIFPVGHRCRDVQDKVGPPGWLLRIRHVFRPQIIEHLLVRGEDFALRHICESLEEHFQVLRWAQ